MNINNSKIREKFTVLYFFHVFLQIFKIKNHIFFIKRSRTVLYILYVLYGMFDLQIQFSVDLG